MSYKKQIAGFEIAMKYVRRVHKEESSQYLIDKVLDVLIAEFLSRVDDAVEVCLHKIGDDVDVGIACFGLRLENIDQADDVVVFEELWVRGKILRSLISRTIRLASMRSSNALMTWLRGGVPASHPFYLFDGHLAVLLAVVRRGHHSVGTRTDLLYDLVFLVDHEWSATNLVQHSPLGHRHLILAARVAL